MMQDFRMGTFLGVCKHLNFTKAAEELHMTQPAVTQHIHYLEKRYGVELFVRSGRNITLTPAGEMLRNAAITMEHDEQALARRMQDVQQRRTYHFGATLTVAEYMLMDKLPRFYELHMGSRIEMEVANTTTLLEMLDSGTINFAIVEGNFRKSEYRSLTFGMEEFAAVGTPDDARRYKGKATAELMDSSLVTREEGSGSRDILERELGQRGLGADQFSNMIELGSIGLIKRMVQSGYGITFMYRAAIRKEEEIGKLAVIHLADFDVAHEIAFVFRKDSLFEDEYEQIYHEFIGD